MIFRDNLDQEDFPVIKGPKALRYEKSLNYYYFIYCRLEIQFKQTHFSRRSYSGIIFSKNLICNLLKKRHFKKLNLCVEFVFTCFCFIVLCCVWGGVKKESAFSKRVAIFTRISKPVVDNLYLMLLKKFKNLSKRILKKK